MTIKAHTLTLNCHNDAPIGISCVIVHRTFSVVGKTRKLKTLKAGIVSHKFPWSPASPVSRRERDERMEVRKRP